jgi:NADH-quinone oxidoreductase subunit M
MFGIEADMLWMTLLVFVPSVFALALVFFPRGSERAMCWWSLAGTAVTLGISIAIFINFKIGVIDFHNAALSTADSGARTSVSLDSRVQAADSRPDGTRAFDNDYVSRYEWIKRFNIEYFLGMDGISLPLVLLTTFLSFLAMIASFHIKRYESTERFVRGYCMLFLILETGMLGTFVAIDFFLFYIFWEVMLLPMYFLIGVWGGPRREYAAIKFFLYTLAGSVLILIAMLGFYFTNLRDFVALDKVVEEATRLKGDNVLMRPEQAFAQAKVNSFDMIALARAGRAALEYMGNDRDVNAVKTRPVIDEIKKRLEKLRTEQKEQGARFSAESRNQMTNYERWLPIAETGFAERLQNQWFFKPAFQYIMFLFLLIGFAIKVPMFPFHTWLPDAHVEAPTPISMILAGVLLKMGGYGIIRIAYPICPWAAQELATWVALFGVISIVYGAFTAMAQTDFKKLVAYSSVSHMGYVVLGIAVWSLPSNSNSWSLGMNGAMFQMIAHGITSAGMFFMVGVIYDRAHHRNLDNFRGLFEPMPLYTGLSAVIFFAAMGLPGMCGFIGEVMVVLSAWTFAPGGAQWVGITFSVLAAVTVVLTAAYILWTIQRVYLGTNPAYKNYSDVDGREVAVAALLIIPAIALGILPNYLLLNWMEPSVTNLVDTLVSYKL